MRLLPYGDTALLVEVDDTAAALACAERVRRHPDAAALLVDLVPGARTVLLRARAGVGVERLRDLVGTLGAAEPAAASPGTGEVVVLPVVYDGPDLDDVARATDLSTAEVVAAHTGTAWRVAFGGFAPGFAYLVGGDPRLQVPRRPGPRASVPAGSVGLAGEFSGVYPRASPGGWQLIGHTDVAMWDPERDPPALLSAGATVRFEVAG